MYPGIALCANERNAEISKHFTHFEVLRLCPLVSLLSGDDTQEHNYDSEYSKPFKTIGKALEGINQCDRWALSPR